MTPLLIAQLTDPHVGADWAPGDPAAALAGAVAAAASVRPAPEVVVLTGDLADHATDDEYGQVRDLLAALDAPVYVLPGNHDERGALRRHFGVPGEGAEPAQYAVELGQLRILMLDSTVPGQDVGSLDGGRLDWLRSALASAPDVPTVLALHHPPLLTGVPGWDEFALAAEDQAALAEILDRHRQVRRVIAGHLHCAITAELAGCPVVATPSVWVQARPDPATNEIDFTDEGPMFAVHTLLDGRLVSRVQR